MWEPFLTPRYIDALLVDGLLDTLKMAFSAIIGAVVFGLVFGVGKLSDHRLAALAVLARRRVLPRRAGAAADDLPVLRVRPRRRPDSRRTGAW